MRNLFGILKHTPQRSANPRSYQPKFEELEARVVPYGATGFDWPHPELVTLSFVPDGTNLGGVTSNLQATLTKKFGSAQAWENIILKAAQTWSAQTNINFSVIVDSGAPSGSGDYQQGDPTMGDIRFGGYNFNNSQALAAADFSPSANNYSVGGDITFNTGVPWNVGSDYDLYTVALHEIGHSLGLDHSNVSSASMYAGYSGAKSALASDDSNGIRTIYDGARGADAYDATAANASFAAAGTISIDDVTNTALVTNLDISSTTDVDYYKFIAPKDSTSTMKVTIQSDGLSLLAPKVWVYNSGQSQIATASGLNHYGTTLTLTVSGIVGGKVYYIKVDGADATAFGTGKYAITINLGKGASPEVPLPDTMTANGTPLHSGGGLGNETMLGVLLAPVDFLTEPVQPVLSPLLGLLSPVVNPVLVTLIPVTSILTEGIFGGYGDLLEVGTSNLPARNIGASLLHGSDGPAFDLGALFGREAGSQQAWWTPAAPESFSRTSTTPTRGDRAASSRSSTPVLDELLAALETSNAHGGLQWGESAATKMSAAEGEPAEE